MEDIRAGRQKQLEKIIVTGGKRLEGTIQVSGAKNAVLPIIAATLLGENVCTLSDIPQLADVDSICQVLTCLGATIHRTPENELVIDPKTLSSVEATHKQVRKMRASFLVMGPLLARFGRVKMSLPGGCAIGTRPIDLHLKGLAALRGKHKNRSWFNRNLPPDLKELKYT